MSLAVHLFLSDARRFRWAIAGWIAAVALAAVFDGMTPGLTSERAARSLDVAGGLLWFSLQVVTIFFVPLIIQADPLVGRDGFWMTRPVPPGSLYAAKIALLTSLFVLVPVAVQSALMIGSHLAVSEVARIALELALFRALWVAALAAAAAITPNLARYAALWGIVVVLTGATLAAFAALTVDRAPTSGPAAVDHLKGDDPTPAIVASVAILVTLLAMCAVQYATRRRVLSVPLLVGAVLIPWPITMLCNWPLFEQKLAPNAWAATPVAPTLLVESRVVRITDANGFNRLDAGMHVAGLPPSWTAAVSLLDATIDAAPQPTALSTTYYGPYRVPPTGTTDDPDVLITRSLLGVERVRTADAASYENHVSIFIARDSKELPGTSGDYRGRFRVSLTQVETAGVVPLQSGAEFRDPAYWIRVRQPKLTADRHVSLEYRESRGQSAFDRRAYPDYLLFLRNMQRKEAIQGRRGHGVAAYGILTLPFSSAESDAFALREEGADFPVVDEDWLRSAELVIIKRRDGGSVVRTVHMPIEVPPPAPPKPL